MNIISISKSVLLIAAKTIIEKDLIFFYLLRLDFVVKWFISRHLSQFLQCISESGTK